MWNRERKSIELTFARSVCPIVAAILLSVSTGAMGQNVQSGALNAGGGDMRIARRGPYVVSDMTLRLNREKCSVGVGRMSFAPRGGIVGEECVTAIDPKTNSAVTTLKLRGGQTVKLRTSLVEDRPIVRLDLPAVAGELVLELTGADRLAFATTNGFAAHTLSRGDRTILLPAAGAFQNRRSQDGIVLHATSNASVRMHVICREGKAAVHLASRNDATTSVVLTGFCGDASIACEDVAPGVRFAFVEGAPAAPAVALAPGNSSGAPAETRGEPVKFTDIGWAWFSNGDRALAPLLADQREAQIRAGYMIGRDADKFLDLGFGGDLGIIRKDFSPDEAMTLTLRGLITARFQTDAESFPLLNTDYYGGLAFGHRFGDNAYELFVYHQSAHLGDETLDFGTRARIDYGREAVRFLWSHDFENLRVYGGPTLNVSGYEPFNRTKVMLQTGGEYRFRSWNVPMYAAADVQVREENDWRPSFNAQLGMYLGEDKATKPKTRVFLEMFTGYSNMGQYWDTYETSAMLGLGYNW